MKTIVTFGEVLCRLTPAGFLRLRQALPGSLDVTFGGAEANVGASIAYFGGKSRIVTALPNNSLSDACTGFFAGLGVDIGAILQSDRGRLGLYFSENGANQRSGSVIYDRGDSSFSLMAPSAYNWDAIFADAGWFHTSGIAPALSQQSAETTITAVTEAKRHGLKVSFDLNFRGKLWNWRLGTSSRELAEETTRQILPFVDLVFANEGAALDTLSIRAPHSNSLLAAHDRYVGREIIQQFPNVSQVAVTLRQNYSASHNSWGATLYDAATDSEVFAPLHKGSYEPYQIHNIVDRIGGGDSFAGGLIFALNTPELSVNSKALSFAVAASCLSHSVTGDINYVSRQEVEALMNGATSGRIVR